MAANDNSLATPNLQPLTTNKQHQTHAHTAQQPLPDNHGLPH
jgi:hypothetical protein